MHMCFSFSYVCVSLGPCVTQFTYEDREQLLDNYSHLPSCEILEK